VGQLRRNDPALRGTFCRPVAPLPRPVGWHERFIKLAPQSASACPTLFWLSCYSEALAGSAAVLSTELATTVAAGSASYSLSCWSWFCSEGFELLLSHRPIGRTLSPPVARSGHRMSAKPCLLSGVKRTPNARPVAAANDPKRTFMVTKTSGQGRPPQAFRRTALL
jgi:hypothetical protein